MRRFLCVSCLIFSGLLDQTPCLGAPACTEPGKARWGIKSSVREHADVAEAKFVRLRDLLYLPDPPDVHKDDARYRETLIPAFENPLYIHEGEIITTKGWVHLVATEGNDCEYHIQVSDDPTVGDNCLIVEVPMDDAISIKSPVLREQANAVREFVRRRFTKGPEPSAGGIVMMHQAYVYITGQLFYADAHIGGQPQGKKGMKAATLWEIHPITAMSFAPLKKEHHAH